MADRIEKQIVIRAPRARVWRALADQTEFGTWFKVNFPPGTFTPGERVSGKITYPGYEHLDMDVDVVEVVPERRLSYRWLPGMPEPGIDYKSEPMTLVTFTLEDAPEGTLLTVVESGFDQLPPGRRERVFRENEGGWAEQMTNIERHVAGG
jgi:uncharacterized protein YndB with AHSA1/START domain